VVPFLLRYTLSRRQRFAAELLPWVPVIAASLGFSTGIAVLAVDVSPWFVVFLLLPLILYHGLFTLLFDLILHKGQSVDVQVDDVSLELRAGDKRLSLPLEGIIQVFLTGTAWTVLHFDGTVLTIPAHAITEEQIDYLKSFARTAAAERKAGRTEG
jgi:hypothetical protein